MARQHRGACGHAYRAGMAFPTFTETAHRLVGHRPPETDEVGRQLDDVRGAFDELIDRVAPSVPEGPDSQIAARRIHDACQAVISAIVHGQ
jgi:hypothetical protein